MRLKRSSGVIAAVVFVLSAGATLMWSPTAGANTSWNPNVGCDATVTTIEQVLGSAANASGGATFGGGGFTPGIPDKRSFTPPCSVNGVPEFVEIDNVKLTCTKPGAPPDGDWTCYMIDPNPPAGTDIYHKKIHIETDKKFQAAAGWTPPPSSTPLDVQGFVYWDADHTVNRRHLYTGWEIHSFTAWRLHTP